MLREGSNGHVVMLLMFDSASLVQAIVRNHPMEYPAFFAGMAVRAVK